MQYLNALSYSKTNVIMVDVRTFFRAINFYSCTFRLTTFFVIDRRNTRKAIKRNIIYVPNIYYREHFK